MQALNAFKQKLFNVKGTVTPLVTLLLHHVIKTDLKWVQVYFVVWQTENVLTQMMSQTKPPLLFSISSLYAAELAPVYFLCEVLNVLWFCWMLDKREASKGITATIMWIMASKQEFICPQHPTNTVKRDSHAVKPTGKLERPFQTYRVCTGNSQNILIPFSAHMLQGKYRKFTLASTLTTKN